MFRANLINIQAVLQRLHAKTQSNKLLRVGIPFSTCFIIAYCIIFQSATVRYEFRKSTVSKELKEIMNPITMEEVYETIKEINVDQWENKRIQRPWQE